MGAGVDCSCGGNNSRGRLKSIRRRAYGRKQKGVGVLVLVYTIILQRFSPPISIEQYGSLFALLSLCASARGFVVVTVTGRENY